MGKNNERLFDNYFSEENKEYNRLVSIFMEINEYYDFRTSKSDLIKNRVEKLFSGTNNLLAQLDKKTEQGKAIFGGKNQEEYLNYVKVLCASIKRLINSQNIQEAIQYVYGEEASKYKI